jgi:hypothetical protein
MSRLIVAAMRRLEGANFKATCHLYPTTCRLAIGRALCTVPRPMFLLTAAEAVLTVQPPVLHVESRKNSSGGVLELSQLSSFKWIP